MKPNKAIIFDLDGTLTDTLLMAVKASQDAIKQTSCKELTYDEIVSQFGKAEEALFKHFCANDWQKAVAAYREFFSANISSDILFPGIQEALYYIKQNNIKTAVVTGRGISAEGILQKTGIRHYFDYLKMGSEMGSIKPQGIREIIEAWQQPAADTYYIGDIAHDIIDSNLAGVNPLAAGWAKTSNKEEQLAQNPLEYFATVQEFIAWMKKL